jgi:septal ring factor EnvC (AmiA/AmiB activator)
MPNDYTLSLQDVMKILGKSERTVQRYLRDGKLSKQYITTERGREIRFSESEVKQLADTLTPVGDTRRRHDDTGGEFMPGLDLKEFFNRYESAVAQVGYFKGKLEAHEHEVKMLAGRVDSLASEKSQLASEQERLKHEKAQAEAKAQELAQTLEQEKATLARKEQEYRTQMRRLRVIYLVMVFILLALAFVLSPAGQELLGIWLGQLR